MEACKPKQGTSATRHSTFMRTTTARLARSSHPRDTGSGHSGDSGNNSAGTPAVTKANRHGCANRARRAGWRSHASMMDFEAALLDGNDSRPGTETTPHWRKRAPTPLAGPSCSQKTRRSYAFSSDANSPGLFKAGRSTSLRAWKQRSLPKNPALAPQPLVLQHYLRTTCIRTSRSASSFHDPSSLVPAWSKQTSMAA